MHLSKTAILSMCFVASLNLIIAGPALAQEADKSKAPAAQEAKPEEPKRDPKALEYEKAIKDLKKYEGAFTVYVRKKDLLLELPEDKLGKLFYIQGAFHHGFSEDPVQAGSPLGGQAVDVYRFDRKEDSLWLVRPNLRYRWDPSDPLAVSAERSMPEAILADYKIEQTNPETKKVLINMNSLVNGDLNMLGMLITILGGAQYSIDRDKSGLDRVIQSADITSLRMNMVYNSRPSFGGENPFAALLGGGFNNQAEDQRSLPIKLTWTLQWKPEKSTYMPRIADPRVGYFTQDYFSIDRFYKVDRTQRFVNRWNLQKKDPSAALSEPVKPIVWTIDHSVPPKFRGAVRDGILRWNRAFEEAGFKNVIQVVDAPANDPDYDHADGRRNVIRFTMTENSGYAIALFRTDPFTGEILNASVTIDANFVSYVNREYLVQTVPSSTAMEKQLELARFGMTSPSRSHLSPRELIRGYDHRVAEVAGAEMRKKGWTPFYCGVGSKVMQNAALEYRMVQAAGMNLSADQFIESYMADVVAHEVGHCLGLRHNFVASTRLTTAELADPTCVHDHQVAASVMDYTPTNVQAVLSKNPKGLHNQSIGAYDIFAIQYGYQPIKATTPEGERFALSQIARRGGEAGLAYMTDEDADSINPFVVRFDLAKDPLNYAEREMLAARRARKWAITNLPRPGESYAERNSIILSTLLRQFREAMGATAFITGVVGNRNFRGDVNEQPTLRPIEPALARQAMESVARNSLSVGSIDVPESVLLTMSQDYNSGTAGTWDAPIRSLISFNQLMLVSQLLNAAALNQVVENQFKFENRPNAYTIDEHMNLLMGAVYSEIGKSQKVPSLRRELQSFTLDSLITQASSNRLQSEVRRVAIDAVNQVKARVARQLATSGNLDSATKSHLTNLARQIRLYENRMMVVSGN